MTVNCPNCGGPISVTDEYCPYCGSLNQTKEKEKVKKAEGKVKVALSKAALMRPLVLIIVLIVLNIIAAGFAGGAYGLGRDRQKAINESRADEIVSQFEGYLADRDYLLAYSYFQSGDYYSLSTMKKYRMVTDALGNYSSIFMHIAPDKPSEYSANALLDNVKSNAMYLSEIYGYPVKNYYDNVPSQEVIDITNDIIHEAESIVAAAYHLTDEETAGLCDMKEEKLAELLKKAYLRHESDTMEPEQETE